MQYLSVGRTVECFPAKSMYVLVTERNGRQTVQLAAYLPELAKLIRSADVPGKGTQFVSNGVPAILWRIDDTLPATVWVCECLSRAEVRELVRLLKQ